MSCSLWSCLQHPQNGALLLEILSMLRGTLILTKEYRPEMDCSVGHSLAECTALLVQALPRRNLAVLQQIQRGARYYPRGDDACMTSCTGTQEYLLSVSSN
jgi:hypothetical protein